jgi:hypothetical protein
MGEEVIEEEIQFNLLLRNWISLVSDQIGTKK